MSENHNTPNASVIIPVYNGEDTVPQLTERLLNVLPEMFGEYEILLVDDCSPDGSAKVMREYEEKYPDLFHCIYQEENQYSKGKMAWWEILFPMAKGDYIAICEGDDYWIDPYKLQKQVDFMEQHPARKPNRLPNYDYSQIGAYFVTVCVQDM